MLMQKGAEREQQAICAIVEAGAQCVPEDRMIGESLDGRRADAGLADAARAAQRDRATTRKGVDELGKLPIVAIQRGRWAWPLWAQRRSQTVEQHRREPFDGRVEITVVLGFRAGQQMWLLPDIGCAIWLDKLMEAAQFEHDIAV